MVVTQAIRTIDYHDIGSTKPFLYALGVHIGLLLLVGVSFHWVNNTEIPARIIKAVVVNADVIETLKRKKVVEKPIKKKVEKKKESKEVERKNKALAEARKRKAIAEEKKRQVAQRKQRDEQALKEMLLQEEQERAQAAKAARAASLVDEYKVAIRQKVSRNWVRPPGASQGLKCIVKVRLGPGGEVLEAKVVRSSGNAVFDRSVENAVYKAAPLPIPRDTDLFDYFREIEFLFNPED